MYTFFVYKKNLNDTEHLHWCQSSHLTFGKKKVHFQNIKLVLYIQYAFIAVVH